ncbi:MAG TPA: hypothetical protein VMB79_00235 [Jatrophihabitans sp.]|nr:hypothetical protein [Jatrophihabitans sp.]
MTSHDELDLPTAAEPAGQPPTEPASPAHPGPAGPTTPPAPPPAPGRGGGRGRLIVAGAIVLAVAGTIVGIRLATGHGHPDTATAPSPAASRPPAGSTPAASGGPSGTGSATGQPSPGPTAVAPAGLLPRGQEAAAAAIPWSQVTDGWNLVVWTSSSTPRSSTQPGILYLVNPIGGRYRIAAVPASSALALWSPDRRRAVLRSYLAGNAVQELDLGTGHRLGGFELGNRSLLGYAGPGGHALLLGVPATGSGPMALVRVSTGGVPQRSYPATGTLTGARALYTADGSTFVVGGQRGFAVLSDAGRLLRQVGLPAGASSCVLEHWWSARVALADCSFPAAAGTSAQNLVLVPVDSGSARPITHATLPDLGFVTGWPVSDGMLVQRAASCGYGPLARIDASGTERAVPVRLPAGVPGQAGLIGVYAGQASLTSGGCGIEPNSLLGLDLRTGVTTALLGPGLNGGSIR